MGTITIRNIDNQLNEILKQNAKKNNLSLNRWLLQVLNRVAGNEKNVQLQTHHELDALSGGWSKKDVQAFDKNTKLFEQVDGEIWK
ncbi:MAG: hypothetical protein AABZ14_08785 [Candidatus Margulisiibacteriota bacterium]